MKWYHKGMPDGLLNIIKRNKLLYYHLKNIRFNIGDKLGGRYVKDIPSPIHYNDFMFDDHYMEKSLKVIKLINNGLNLCNKDWNDIKACLEIGSGFGRIIRLLIGEIPPKRIYVSDIIEQGPKFCAKYFFVNYIPSEELFAPKYFSKYDLIYLWSVFTHLPNEDILDMWSHMLEISAKSAVIIFTTCDNYLLNKKFGKSDVELKQLESLIETELAEKGYYYLKYNYYKDNIGISWHRPDFIRDFLEEPFPNKVKHILTIKPTGLDRHSVHIFQKVA